MNMNLTLTLTLTLTQADLDLDPNLRLTLQNRYGVSTNLKAPVSTFGSALLPVSNLA